MTMTFSELKTNIRNYAETDSGVLTDAVLTVIVKNVENRIFRAVDSDDTKFYANSDLTIGNRFVTVPSDTRIIRYVQLTNPTTSDQFFLEQVDTSFLAEYFPDPDNSSDYATPRYYAHWDSDNWVVAPTPDAAYAITLAYIKQPDTITTSDSSSTYLSNNFQDLLIYGCMVETLKYLKGPDNMIQIYEASYQEGLQTFAAEQQGRRRRDEYTSGAIRLDLQSPQPKMK